MSQMAIPRSLDVEVIQGGMGVAVSQWRLARAVSRTGQLGVVSGTALDAVHARLLQDGDPGGHLRRAYAQCPLEGIADRVLARWYQPDGRRGRPYRAHPMLTMDLDSEQIDLLVLANFAEVWLAKEGHDGVVGVNHLEKIQMAILPSLYGAVLAGADAVLMGAGIPAAIPSMLDHLAHGLVTSLRIDVDGAPADAEFQMRFDPADLSPPTERPRPAFLAIVSSVSLARYLARDERTRPDGFVVELPEAGGHNAPPRGPRQPHGAEPVYGPRDDVDLSAVAKIGLPFWAAGGYGTAAGLRQAQAAGAQGVQLGTAFALCEESGFAPSLRATVREMALGEGVTVRTDGAASPSGYPFKVAHIPGTLSEADVVSQRRRVCDLGFLRTPYLGPDGQIGYRCASEPVDTYVAKGGDRADTEGRLCLCNGLTAAVGLAQLRRGVPEPALVTVGGAVHQIGAFRRSAAPGYTAADVVHAVLGGSRLDGAVLSDTLD